MSLQQMADVSNILAQVVPLALTETALYTVGLTVKARLDEIIVCNRSGSPASFRISISLKGVATSAKDYLYFDMPILGNDTFANELGLTIDSLDDLRVFASTANLTFTLLGKAT